MTPVWPVGCKAYTVSAAKAHPAPVPVVALLSAMYGSGAGSVE